MLTFILWSLLLLHHQKFRLTWLHNNSNFSLPLSPPQSKDIFLYFVDCFISLITLMIKLSYSPCQAWGWTSSSCQSTTSWWRWWCFRVKLQFGGLSCCLLCGISQNFPSNLLPRLLDFYPSNFRNFEDLGFYVGVSSWIMLWDLLDLICLPEYCYIYYLIWIYALLFVWS